MKSKQILILALILGVLVLGVLAKQFQKPAELATQEYAPLDLSFDSGNIASIEISKAGAASPIQLAKENNAWKVTSLWNARADQDKINRFFDAIKGAQGELRGTDQALFADFGIEDNKAFLIDLKDGTQKSVLTLLIGTKKADYASLFVRKKGVNLVYLTNANLLAEMGIYGDPAAENPAGDYWVSTSLLQIQIDSIQKLETKRLMNGQGIVTAAVLDTPNLLDSTKKQWQFLRNDLPFALDAEKVKQYLNGLTTWRAQKVLDPNAKDHGFLKPTWQLTLTSQGGKQITMTAGGRDAASESVYMKVSSEPVVFQLSKYYFENMDIDDSRFFVDNPLGIDPDQTEKLVTRAGKTEMRFSPKEKKGDALAGYLNDLKTFSVSKLMFNAADQKKVRSPSATFIEIEKSGAPSQRIDVGEMISQETKEYAALKRGHAQVFTIPEDSFKKLFDNLNRLTEPKSEPKKEETKK